ncbi:MAG: phosphatidylserine decarboxylase [Phycisphaerales bacterium]|nr:MAG: phosphatidylserine decarboxylase [Phycisphaerales bacterium]
MMPIAREGLRQIVLSTLLLAALGGALAWWLGWPAATPFLLVWVWVLSFFRDPPRRGCHPEGALCSACDGTVTEISRLDHHETIGGPAVRIGAFLSLFNVHVNRSPCSGRVRSIRYQPGEFLDARHPQSGRRNESNTLVIDPDPPMPGPVVVRQVAGKIARRIICHPSINDYMEIGYRFGLIKFGSRTEVILPERPGTKVLVTLGQKVRGGLTLLAVQEECRMTTESRSSKVDGRKEEGDVALT